MKLIYISVACPENTLLYYETKYRDQNKKNIQQRWDLALAKELKKIFKEDMICISYPPVATFPSSKCFIFSRKQGDSIGDLHISYTSCCNLPIIKQAMEVFEIKKIIKKNKYTNNEKIIVLTTSINYQSYKAYESLKRKYPNIKIVSIVPDLPDHMVSTSFAGHPLLNKLLGIYKKKTVMNEKKYDGYICFTSHQLKYLNSNVSNMLMEGFIDSYLVESIAPKTFERKVITYAGGITKRYGVIELVNGFIDAKLQDVELHLYGTGDCVEEISHLEEKGVYYKGLVSREEVIAIEKGSYLLVNPRPTDDEYSWCSFPSKIMEYLASGTPVVTTKLLCFTDEWLPMMSYFEDINKETISNMLHYCVAHYEELRERSIIAQGFVKNCKSCESQAERIGQFLKNGIYSQI